MVARDSSGRRSGMKITSDTPKVESVIQMADALGFQFPGITTVFGTPR